MLTSPAQSLFQKVFGFAAPHSIRVPGRILLLGDHTVQHEGLLIAATIPRYAEIVASPRTDGRIELVTADDRRRIRFGVHELDPVESPPWLSHLRAVLREMQRKNLHFSGFTAAVHVDSDHEEIFAILPALDVAVALLIRELHPFSIHELGPGLPPSRNQRGRLPPPNPKEKRHLAKLCARAAGEAFGRQTSPESTLCSLLGRAHHVLHYDGRFGNVDHSPLVGETLVVWHSGDEEPGQDLDELRSNLQHQGGSAAHQLRARSLRSVELAWLKANRRRLTALEFRHAYHIVTEIQRVVYAEKALQEDDHAQFGHYLRQSHESARDQLGPGPALLDKQIQLACRLPGCSGARAAGLGLEGVALALVTYHEVQTFQAELVRRVADDLGQIVRPQVLPLVNGAPEVPSGRRS